MCAGELDVDPVSVDAKYFGAGEIGDCQGIMDGRTIEEIEGVFVCIGEEEDEGRERVPERCCGWWHILEAVLWVKWHGHGLRLSLTPFRSLSQAGSGQKTAVKGRGEDCRMGHIEWDHSLLDRGIKDDLSCLG